VVLDTVTAQLEMTQSDSTPHRERLQELEKELEAQFLSLSTNIKLVRMANPVKQQ
jgi:hypothetical protein